MKNWLLGLLVIFTSGCPDIQLDPDETGGGPTVEFDPARSLATKARFVPFPNDLVRDPTTGKVSLSEQACESAASKATRENILNKLDGFGTYETPIQVTLTQEVDESTLVATGGAGDTVVMYQLSANAAAAVKVPILVQKGSTVRLLDGMCTAPETVNTITIVPLVPLAQKTSYVVAVLSGLKSAGGDNFAASYTWSLVKAPENPVTLDEQGNIASDRTPLDPADPGQLAQLMSLSLLWNLHAPALTFLENVPNARPRADVLVAFQFTTQTTTDPLDPSVANSLAANLPTQPFAMGPGTVTNRFGALGTSICNDPSLPTPETNQTQCFLKLALGGCNPLTTGCSVANYNVGNATCAALGCASIGDVLGGGVVQTVFQTPMPNPLAGGATIPGPWPDPILPTVQASAGLEVLIVVPPGAAPATGWPVVVFGHGLGSSKEALFAIAASFARAGFASVAIDFQSHGSRAVRISKDPLLGCIGRCATAGVYYDKACDTVVDCDNPTGDSCGVVGMPGVPPAPTSAPQCYAPFLSSDLATTRDGIRQTVLDLQRLVRALRTCGTAGCNGFTVDVNRMVYTGQSLGALIGTTFVGVDPTIQIAVLNVGGVGWADVLENTDALPIRCSLVDGLIDAGILMGDKWNKSTTAPTGLCTTPEWKTQPGYRTFAAIGRWVLDPADGANFARMTAMNRILIQEVVGDAVVPNIATERQAALVGLAGMDMAADPAASPTPAASTAITTNPMSNKWVKYTTLPPQSPFPGNTFEHPSLLRPSAGTAGSLGTVRLQTDAITFLRLNLP